MPSLPHKAENTSPLRGMGLAFFGFLFFSCQDVLMAMNTQFYPSLQLVWINSATVLVTLLVILWVRKGWRGLKTVLHTQNLKYHLLRGAMVAVGMVLVFVAIRDMPLPNFYTIIFIAPILAVALSGVFLKEHISFGKALALLGGFVGLVIALQPGADGFNAHSITVLIAACLFGATALMGRFLIRKDSALSLIFYPMMMVMVLFSIPAAMTAVPIIVDHLPQVMLASLFTTLGFFFNAHAYKIAPLYLLAPCQFLQLLWGGIAHAVLHNALPSRDVMLGAALIILSNMLIIILQMRQQRESVVK